MKNIIYYPARRVADESAQKIVTRGQCDCDCDCACASAGSPVSLDLSRSGLWRKADDVFSLSLSSEHHIFVSAENNGFAILNSRAGKILNSFESPFSIANATTTVEPVNPIVHLATAGLLSSTENDCACASSSIGCRSANASDSLLAAWLHLTDRCNLRCSYCYLPHLLQDMSYKTGHMAVERVFHSALLNDFKQVKLKYAGGEPLLRYPLILDLHAHAKALAEQNGLLLEEVVLSNGTLLTDEMSRTLRELHISLMISLDGYGAYHDIQRPYAGGRGSFDDVAEAVAIAMANGLVPIISVTVSSRTVDGLPDVMAWILERDLPFGINFYRVNELSASNEDMCLDEEKIISGMLNAFKVIEHNLPRGNFLGGIIDRANLSSSHTHTCGVGKNYLVFDQHGQVAKCQMSIRQPVTNMHSDDPLALIRSDQFGIQNISVDEKEGCKGCEWRYWCAGGCPLETHRATGRYDVKSPNCGIYKALYPEALRLEGLRLLKYQDDPDVVTKY